MPNYAALYEKKSEPEYYTPKQLAVVLGISVDHILHFYSTYENFPEPITIRTDNQIIHAFSLKAFNQWQKDRLKKSLSKRKK